MGKVTGDHFLLHVIRFVHDEEHLALGAAEEVGDELIDGVDSFASIHNEEDEVAGVHRDAGLDGDLFREFVIKGCSDSSGVDQFTGSFSEVTWRCDPVACDTGAVVHEGDASACKPIEEGGLADVGAANDCYLEGFLSHKRCVFTR